MIEFVSGSMLAAKIAPYIYYCAIRAHVRHEIQLASHNLAAYQISGSDNPQIGKTPTKII